MIHLFILFIASAHALAKVDAERNGHLLVSDVGLRPGELDPDDEITDLDQPCADVPPRAALERRAHLAAGEPDRVGGGVEEILARAKLAGFRPRSSIVDAHVGEGNLVILAPEIHLELDHRAGNRRLHGIMTADLVDLTARLVGEGRAPLNAIESYRPIRPTLGLGRTAPGRRQATAARLVHTHHLGSGDAIAQLFANDVRSVAVDEPELYARQRVALFASYLTTLSPVPKARRALERLRAHLGVCGDLELLGRFPIGAFFQELLEGPAANIDQINAELCERRSRRMAERALGPAASGQVVLFQLGALHVHGVRARLRELGASYLILSP